MSEPLSELSASFHRHLRAEGRAERTWKIYEQAIRFFSDWLAAQGKPATTDELTRDNIRTWLAELADRVEPGTVQMRWQGMRRFTRWLVAEGELDAPPMEGMGKPEIPEKPVPVLSDDELTALLRACQGKTFYERRDEAIIRLLLDCGLRVSELCGIGLDENFDLETGTAMVTGKRAKKRQVYFGARTARALDRYLRLRKAHRWAHLAALFIGERGAMTPDGIRDRMIVRSEQAGLTSTANPHRYRHTWAHDFLLAGGQERDLKRLAGWSSDIMLERYGRSAADARAEAAARGMKRGDRV